MSIGLIIIGLVVTVLVYRHRLRKTREVLTRVLTERDAYARAYVQTVPTDRTGNHEHRA